MTPIAHGPNDPLPVVGVVYRCHVCRLELVVDPETGQLALAQLDSPEPPLPEVSDLTPPAWVRCPQCKQLSGQFVPHAKAPNVYVYHCDHCEHVWRVPREAPEPPGRAPKRRSSS